MNIKFYFFYERRGNQSMGVSTRVHEMRSKIIRIFYCFYYYYYCFNLQCQKKRASLTSNNKSLLLLLLYLLEKKNPMPSLLIYLYIVPFIIVSRFCSTRFQQQKYIGRKEFVNRTIYEFIIF